jgi:phosphoglycerate dehydrogenase-like enzyme/quinol monooxygenase YgiN
MSAEPFVVIAEVRLKPGSRDAFLELARRHADNTRANEPGCRQFDVTVPAGDPDTVVFYEVFDDAEAFAAHGRSAHLAWFREATGRLILDRRLRELSRVAEGAARGPRRVLVTVPYLRERRHLLRPLEQAGYSLTYNELGHVLTEAELRERLPGHVATIASMEPYNEAVLSSAPDLRLIARLGVGWDRIDLAAATRHGVAVAMAFGTNHDAVADHAFALMAALAQRIVDYDRRARAGQWGSLFHGRLHGTTVGIAGFGRVGRALAKRCQGFAMEVLVHDPVMDADTVARLGCTLVGLDELLRRSDFVTLHPPLTPDTAGMIDARRLALMRPTSFLINTARGGLVDEPALIEALRAGRIGGAALDVFAVEPLPAGSPLRELEKTVLSPHVAGSSEAAVEAMARRCVETILEIGRGEDPGDGLVLNPEVLLRR